MHDEVLVVGPGEGRAYEIGPMRGVFKADGVETEDRYSVSEWSVEPGCEGPGAHSHESHEHLFLVTRGTMSFLVGSEWLDLPEGTFLRIPAGVVHDFANRTTEPATAFSVTVPGISGFEASFAAWAAEPAPER